MSAHPASSTIGHGRSGPERPPDPGRPSHPAPGSAQPWRAAESDEQAEGQGAATALEVEGGASEALMDTYNG